MGAGSMYYDEYGKENEKIIVMLHGANFVHSFGKQYQLADRYHIIVPHLMGYGNETDKIFNADEQINELVGFISSLEKKVALVGFSLGAQIGFRLAAEHQELFTCEIVVSPWLCKNKETTEQVLKENEKQFALFKKKWLCSLIGLMNGLPKEQRKEFVEQMQKVSIDTVRNSVDNGITLESVSSFENLTIPVMALAGGKEQDVVKNSVIKMSRLNKYCSYEIWDKAAHNIPAICAKQFNELICKIVG